MIFRKGQSIYWTELPPGPGPALSVLITGKYFSKPHLFFQRFKVNLVSPGWWDNIIMFERPYQFGNPGWWDNIIMFEWPYQMATLVGGIILLCLSGRINLTSLVGEIISLCLSGRIKLATLVGGIILLCLSGRINFPNQYNNPGKANVCTKHFQGSSKLRLKKVYFSSKLKKKIPKRASKKAEKVLSGTSNYDPLNIRIN